MTNSVQSKQNENKISFKEALLTYFKGVKVEWGKISWPQKNQIIFETGVVIFVVVAFTIIVYLMDIIFKAILGLLPH